MKSSDQKGGTISATCCTTTCLPSTCHAMRTSPARICCGSETSGDTPWSACNVGVVADETPAEGSADSKRYSGPAPRAEAARRWSAAHQTTPGIKGWNLRSEPAVHLLRCHHIRSEGCPGSPLIAPPRPRRTAHRCAPARRQKTAGIKSS